MSYADRKEYFAEYYSREENRLRKCENTRAWYQAHKERKAEVSRAWYQANAERRREQIRAWKRDNPVLHRLNRNLAAGRKRMAAKRELIAQLEAQLKEPIDG